MAVLARTHDPCPLTPAELRVLELLMQGLSYDEIALALDRRTSTIRSQLNSAYRRLGVRTSYQAVLQCVRAGWLVWSEDDPEIAILIRIEELLRRLVLAVEAREELSAEQRAYLESLDEYLRARDPGMRDHSRARMEDSLRTMLARTGASAEPHVDRRDLIAELGLAPRRALDPVHS